MLTTRTDSILATTVAGAGRASSPLDTATASPVVVGLEPVDVELVPVSLQVDATILGDRHDYVITVTVDDGDVSLWSLGADEPFATGTTEAGRLTILEGSASAEEIEAAEDAIAMAVRS